MVRRPLSQLCAPAVILLTVGLAGCGGSPTTAAPEDGLRANPSSGCEEMPATYHDGSRPARRPIGIPPAPGLRAVAITKRTTHVEWWFDALPAACRPVAVVITVDDSTAPLSTPTREKLNVRRTTGSATIAYPSFLPPPDVATASAYSHEGIRSRVVSVRIERAAELPPDPPKPTPPITAPAGRPVTCAGAATAVRDPVGDVLSYEPGSPPTQVATLAPALSAIDITQATVQIDVRTICATFVFDRPPADIDFELAVAVRDTKASSCCGRLRFRRTDGRLEVGHDVTNRAGGYELHEIRDAGAALHDRTLVITGTLPPPGEQPGLSPQLPSPADIGWSATTRYTPTEYGPYFGDWVPRYEAVDEPIVRHRDGATIRPGTG